MTISSTTRKAGPFTGDGVVVVFPFAFKVFTAADLLVVQTTAGADSTKALTTDYTVALNADQNASPGGSVTMLVSPPVGSTLTLTSQVANTQGTDLTNLGGFFPKTITDALDRATIQIQQLAGMLARALQLPVSSTASGTLPAPAASSFLGWDNLGASIINYAGLATTAVSAAMAPVIAAGTLALARIALGVTTVGDALFTAATAAAARATLGSGATGDALFLTATAAAARTALGFTAPPIDRAYVEFSTWASSSTQIPYDNTIPQNTEGTQLLSVSLTPKAVTNRLRLQFCAQVTSNVANTSAIAALFSSASANALAATVARVDTIGDTHSLVLEHEYVPGVTTPLTFSVRYGPDQVSSVFINGTTSVGTFGGVNKATLVVEEIAA